MASFSYIYSKSVCQHEDKGVASNMAKILKSKSIWRQPQM